jgi:hypothetical protein
VVRFGSALSSVAAMFTIGEREQMGQRVAIGRMDLQNGNHSSGAIMDHRHRRRLYSDVHPSKRYQELLLQDVSFLRMLTLDDELCQLKG